MRLRWLPEAQQDIERLYHFLRPKNPSAAREAIALIKAGAKQLQQFPKSGKPMNDELQRYELYMRYGNGAYVLRYVINNQDIIVIRVWHSRENRH